MSLSKVDTGALPALPVITVTFVLVDNGHCDDRVVARATIPSADRAGLALAFRICQEVAEAAGWICGVEQYERKLYVELDEYCTTDENADLCGILRAACERAVQKRTAHPLGIATHLVEVR